MKRVMLSGGASTPLGEASGGGLHELLVRQISERVPTPEGESLAQELRGGARLGPFRGPDEPLEAIEVALIGPQSEHVARRLGHERFASRAERPAKIRDPYFDPSAPPASTNAIPCKRGNPPPWARS